MAGFGSMDFMNKTIANNRALLKKKKPFSDQKHYNKYAFLSKKGRPRIFKKASPEVLTSIRQKMKLHNKTRSVISVFAMIISIAITAGLFWWIF